MPSENAPVLHPAASPAADISPLGGLHTEEARRRLAKVGPNAMPDTTGHPLRRALGKLWAPVPWMLEAAIVLQIALGDYTEAAIIAGLLVFNAALGLFQEGKAQATLEALKSKLALNASVRRDGSWSTVAATELVPGDVVKLSVGAVVAADVRIAEGEVLVDQSMLTGESVPIEAGVGAQTYAGALYGGARRWRRSRKPEHGPSLAAPPSWSVPPMSSVPSKKRFCAWCAISQDLMVSSLCCWWPSPPI